MVVESYASGTESGNKISHDVRRESFGMFAGRQEGGGTNRCHPAGSLGMTCCCRFCCYSCSCNYMVMTVGFELEVDHGR